MDEDPSGQRSRRRGCRSTAAAPAAKQDADPGEPGLLDRAHRRHPSEVEALLGDQPAPGGDERDQAHQQPDADGGRRRRPAELGEGPRHRERDDVRSPQRPAQERRPGSRDAAVCVAYLVIGGPFDQRTVLLMPDPSRQPLVANDNAHARPPPSLGVLWLPSNGSPEPTLGRRRGESHCSSWSRSRGTPTESDRIGDFRRRKHLPPTCFVSFCVMNLRCVSMALRSVESWRRSGITTGPRGGSRGTGPSGSASTTTMAPSAISPASRALASGSATSRWMTRFSGRAPNAGS